MVQSSPPNTTYNNTNKRSQLKPPNEIFKIDVGIYVYEIKWIYNVGTNWTIVLSLPGH
jgi:hypothetical protein